MPDYQAQPAACARAERAILVVDDEPPYAVALAGDGAAALQYVRTHPLPMCMLLDVRMPTMDGLTVCQVLHEVPELAAIPIILMSATRRSVWTEADLPVAGYLEKPFPLDPLLAFVEQVTH